MEDEKKFEILSNFASNLAGNQKTIVESLQHGNKDRYLFRGLRTDGKGWVYGGLSSNPNIDVIYIECWEDEDYDFFGEKFLVQYEVIPETVGQWTGLLDKNGTKIFEGDIINAVDILNDRSFSGVAIFRNAKYLVQINHEYYFLDLSYVNNDEIEVIGNIHEEGK